MAEKTLNDLFLAHLKDSTPMMSDSFMIRSSWPSILTSVPDHLPNSTRSPTLRSIGMILQSSSRPPGPYGNDLALRGLLLGGVGDDDATGGLPFGINTLDNNTIV